MLAAVRKLLELPSCGLQGAFYGLGETTEWAWIRPSDIWFIERLHGQCSGRAGLRVRARTPLIGQSPGRLQRTDRVTAVAVLRSDDEFAGETVGPTCCAQVGPHRQRARHFLV
jgi:hypothetical protein